MSQESAKKFVEKMQKDQNFKQKLQQAKNEEDVKSILEQNDFHFTEEEYKTAYKNVMGKEISDQELTRIAGGNATLAFTEE
jgi:predicted ribosomally synthesized peptide with nif11-like leader